MTKSTPLLLSKFSYKNMLYVGGAFTP